MLAPSTREGKGPVISSTTDHPFSRYRLRESAYIIAIIFVILQVGSVIVATVSPASFPYLSSVNLSTALAAIPELGVVAVGVGLLMIAGEFDLSVGANYIFSSMVMAQLASRGLNPLLAGLVALCIGLGIGVSNGLITLHLRLPSFIVTLGTMGIWSAATLLVHGAAAQTFTPTGLFVTLTTGSLWVINAAFFWFIGFALLAYLLLRRHKIGSAIFAAGGNATGAVASGINLRRVKLFAFGVSGLCASMAGVLAASRVGDVSPSGGTTLALEAIAACVIGGVTLTGGRGSVLGIVLGASLLYWIQDVLLLAGAPSYYLTGFVGVLIITMAFLFLALEWKQG